MADHRFNVGDVVVGNEKTYGVYSVTKQGWVGRVEKVRFAPDGVDRIFVRSIVPEEESDCWWVDAERFDLYETGNSFIDEMFDEFS